jgi:protein-L-isoaspartate O-methyltransferase
MTSPGNDSRSSNAAQRVGRTVVGIFRNRPAAEDAIRDLKDAGYTSDQIAVATNDQSESKERVEEGGILVTVTATDGAPEALIILQRHGGDLGASSGERRTHTDASYSGPERRLVGA